MWADDGDLARIEEEVTDRLKIAVGRTLMAMDHFDNDRTCQRASFDIEQGLHDINTYVKFLRTVQSLKEDV